MTIPTKAPSYDDAIALIAGLSIADIDTAGKVVSELFGVPRDDVSRAVVAYWDLTDPWSIADGKVLIRVEVDGTSALVELGTADETQLVATIDSPATILGRSKRFQADNIRGEIAEVRGWLEEKGYQVTEG